MINRCLSRSLRPLGQSVIQGIHGEGLCDHMFVARDLAIVVKYFSRAVLAQVYLCPVHGCDLARWACGSRSLALFGIAAANAKGIATLRHSDTLYIPYSVRK